MRGNAGTRGRRDAGASLRRSAEHLCPHGRPVRDGVDCSDCQALRAASASLMDALAAPARRALRDYGIETVLDLAAFPEAEIRALHGIGDRAMDALIAALGREGLSFAPPRD